MQDDAGIKDEDARKDIQILSTRLYDLKERFGKTVQKINQELEECAEQISDQDGTTDDESTDEISVDEEENETRESNGDDDEKKTQKLLIKCIVESKAHRYEYLRHLMEYPKIMAYLQNNDPTCLHIPLRYLEPFIQKYVEKHPTGKIYDKINQHIQDIRHSYLKNCQ